MTGYDSYYDPPDEAPWGATGTDWDDYDGPDEPDPDMLRDAQIEREWAAEALSEDGERPECRVPVVILKQGYDAIVAWQASHPA